MDSLGTGQCTVSNRATPPRYGNTTRVDAAHTVHSAVIFVQYGLCRTVLDQNPFVGYCAVTQPDAWRFRVHFLNNSKILGNGNKNLQVECSSSHSVPSEHLLDPDLRRRFTMTLLTSCFQIYVLWCLYLQKRRHFIFQGQDFFANRHWEGRCDPGLQSRAILDSDQGNELHRWRMR